MDINDLRKTDEGVRIDAVYDALMSQVRSKDYGLEALSGGWGRIGSNENNMKKLQFIRGIRQLARECAVKYFSGKFYVFNGKVYEVISEDSVCEAYERMLLTLGIGSMLGRGSIRRENFLSVIRSYNALEPHRDIVAFANGVLDMSDSRKPVLHEFSPDYHVIDYRPYAYDPTARCDRWNTFLHEVLPEDSARLILQMFLGLGLIPRGIAFDPYKYKAMSRVDLCLLLVGQGANGKSVIFDVVRAVFGPDKISAMDYDNLVADGDEGMRGRYPIRNMVFNFSSDSDPKRFGRRNTGMFKRLVSGEPVPYRKLGQDVMQSGRLPYLIFSLNDLPMPDDTSLGFIRRLQYISFDVVIPKQQQDPELSQKLIASELPGIFNWILRGTNELKRRRFKFPISDGSQRALTLTLLYANSVIAWVQSYGLRNKQEGPDDECFTYTSQELYASYKQFCEDNGVEEKGIVSAIAFGKTLRQKCYFFSKRASTGPVYQLFGCPKDSLMSHVLVTDEDAPTPEPSYSEDTFIKDDD